MEHFLRIDTTPRERKDVAACLRWLRVITIADLADERGTEIPGGRLTGEWRAEPCFEWPHQPRPGKRAWATLSRTLRETLCFETNRWQPITAAMKLLRATSNSNATEMTNAYFGERRIRYKCSGSKDLPASSDTLGK
jgi:hypothetical protein